MTFLKCPSGKQTISGVVIAGLSDSSMLASDECRSWRWNLWKPASLQYSLVAKWGTDTLGKILELDITLTFRNCEKTKEHHTIAMCMSNIIADVTDRKINQPVLVVSSSYRYCSFITAKNNGAEDGAMCFVILWYYVLIWRESALS